MSSVQYKVVTVVVLLHPHCSAHFGKISYIATQMLCVSCFLVETEEGKKFPIRFDMKQAERVSKGGQRKL